MPSDSAGTTPCWCSGSSQVRITPTTDGEPRERRQPRSCWVVRAPQVPGESNVAPEEFARRAGLAFRDPELLWRALTHRSYLNEHTDALEDNERLAFLGGAGLGFLSAASLYRRFRGRARRVVPRSGHPGRGSLPRAAHSGGVGSHPGRGLPDRPPQPAADL